MEVDSARQLVKHYTANIIAFDQAKFFGVSVIPDCVFPESFSLKRQTYIPFDINAKSDRTPILLETTIKRALETIKTEADITGTATYRVPPVAITSMARSGKTTLLHALFNKILEEGRFNPILVDFNGNGGFLRRDKESDDDAFLRWVATSLLYDEDVTVPAFNCKKEDLEKYLSKSPKPIVLLVDELNALTYQAGQKVPVSKDLAKLLRKMFLDQPARYLCFTSHWFMNLEDVVGQATEGSPSPRNTHFVEVPVTQCVKTINKLLQKKDITPVEVAAGVGAVGLLVSIHDQDYIPTQQFQMRTQKLKSYPVESFLEEFCGGNERNIDMRAFDTFTTRLHGGKIVWPLCFAKAFLHAANEVQLHALIEHAEHAIGMQSSGTGLEWEYTARIAVAIIARCAEFRDLTPIEAQVIGLSVKCRPELHIVQLPEEIQNPESAQEHVDAFVEECQRYPILVLAYPRSSNFSIFDTITCFKASEGSDTKFTGQQMKQDDTVPGKDAPFNGVLLRGDAPSTSSGPRKRKNWKYLDREEVKLFLPYSLHPLIPSEWLRKV